MALNTYDIRKIYLWTVFVHLKYKVTAYVSKYLIEFSVLPLLDAINSFVASLWIQLTAITKTPVSVILSKIFVKFCFIPSIRYKGKPWQLQSQILPDSTMTNKVNNAMCQSLSRTLMWADTGGMEYVGGKSGWQARGKAWFRCYGNVGIGTISSESVCVCATPALMPGEVFETFISCVPYEVDMLNSKSSRLTNTIKNFLDVLLLNCSTKFIGCWNYKQMNFSFHINNGSFIYTIHSIISALH